jgi:TPR repeat protein
MSTNLERSQDPGLNPQEFKELLDLQDEYVYESLDLNDVARYRYLDFLDTQPEINYYPNEEDGDAEVLRKANSGDHRSQFQMAVKAMDTGNEISAAEWFRKAAEIGNILCAYNYALTLPNWKDQLHWFKKAGFKGLPAAQREIGKIYSEQGDIEKAKLWLGLAIRRENVDALNDMGVLHYDLDEIELATHYWRQAAERGVQEAIDNLQSIGDPMLESSDVYEVGVTINQSPSQKSFSIY